MAMDQEEMVDFLFGALARAMKHRKAALAREEAEARGVFDDEDDEDDDEGLIALEHLRSQGRVGDAPPLQAPAPSPHNDLLARARAELEELRQREAVARMRIEIRKQREATAEVEALADEDLSRVQAEIAAQKMRTEAAEAADSRAAGSGASVAASGAAESAAKGAAESSASGESAREAEVADTGAAASPATEAKVAATVEVDASGERDDRLAAVEAMGELMLGSDGPAEESKALAVVDRDDDDDDSAVETDEDDDDGESDDDDDPVAAHPLIVGQQALRRGDARAALDLFTGVVDETRTAHKRQPKDATIAAGLCQSLRAAATARLALADFSAAIRDASEAVDIAIAFHKRTPSAEALTEVAGSLCDKVEVLLAVGDRQGATTIASNGVRALKKSLKRHTSHEALALFERLRSLRAMLTRRHAS